MNRELFSLGKSYVHSIAITEGNENETLKVFWTLNKNKWLVIIKLHVGPPAMLPL